MANRNFTQKFFSLHNYPVLLDCNFIVNNAVGAGVTSLKGAGIQSVFMNTVTTPAAGSPNPAAGIAMIMLQDNYPKYLSGFAQMTPPSTGIALTSGLTVGQAYVINALSSTTLAQWRTAGLMKGITPAVGVPFIAAATSVAGGGSVSVVSSAAPISMEVLGLSNTTVANAELLAAGVGPYLLVRFTAPQALSFAATTNTNTTVSGIAAAVVAQLKVGMAISGAGIPLGTTIATIASGTSVTISQAATASATITAVVNDVNQAVAPVNGAKISIAMYFNNSSIAEKGE